MSAFYYKNMGNDYNINCKKGETVLEALQRQGITINAMCGGHHSCGKCRVFLNESDMSEPSYEEIALMSEDDNANRVRLACFVRAIRDIDYIRVNIPDDPDKGASILTDAAGFISESLSTSSCKQMSFAAFDLGTTTLATKLINNGSIIYTGSRHNSQAGYGADVVSRSEASINGNADDLRHCLEDDINSLIREFPRRPELLVMAGNTTMIHLLMGYPLDKMVNFPFSPYFSGWHRYAFQTPGGTIPCTILPNLSAYIGGDIISGLYYCGFAQSENINLFVDLGTNGEMAIGNRNRILTASAAAGPAFEGTPINVATDVVKCMADLRRTGIIDENGLLKDPYFDDGYCYEAPSGTINGGCVTITQQNIRDIQMAKSAIRAGITILMNRYGVLPDEISNMYLAGGMGHGLDIESAVSIGLFPKELADIAVPVGNSSLAGCIKYGNQPNDDVFIDNLLSVSQEILLSNDEDFCSLYYEHMMF